MASELEKLAQIADAQGSEIGAEITRVNAGVLLDMGLIPPALENPIEIISFADFKKVGTELINQGYETGGRFVAELGRSLSRSGVIFLPETQGKVIQENPTSRKRGRPFGSSLNYIRIDGQVFKDLRRAHNLTQAQLASQIGISGSMISLLESGSAKGYKPRLSPETAKVLSEVFGINFSSSNPDRNLDDQDRVIGLDEEEQFDPEDLISVIRKKAGLTQQALADILGVSGSLISLVENKKHKPSKRLLRKISEKFGIVNVGLDL